MQQNRIKIFIFIAFIIITIAQRQDQSFHYMHNYTSYICSPRYPLRNTSASTPTHHYLTTTLSLTLVKSALARLYIQNLSYAFKQIQFKMLQQAKIGRLLNTKQTEKNSSEPYEKKGKAFYKEKSLQILRKIQTSLDKKKVTRSQQPRLISKSTAIQKNKIIEQITQKLEAKNRNSPIQVEKQERPHLNRRIARLQTFMQQIKRQRQLNDKPTIILEKKKIDRINYHMLQQKLAEQRKKIDGLNKHKQIFGSLQQIREELKNMKKTQEMFANPESIQEIFPQINKKEETEGKVRINEPVATVERQRSQTQHQQLMINAVQPQSFQFSSRPKVRFINNGPTSRRITFLKPQ